jgi:hypothetical protein
MSVGAIVHQLPLPFAGRLTLALVEIAVAVAMLVGSVILGHELKAWRDWYGDPGTARPWAPTPRPTVPPTFELTEP